MSSSRAAAAAGMIVCALAIVSACGSAATNPALEGVDASEPPPSFGYDGGAPADPLASDAAIGVRASQVFLTCQGGVESGCHGIGEAGLHLRLGANGDLIGIPSTERPSLARVVPGDPDRSYLYLKVLGDGGIEGGRMPLGAGFDSRLPPFIASWIEAGAPSP